MTEILPITDAARALDEGSATSTSLTAVLAADQRRLGSQCVRNGQ
jgi:hypothetical protein